MGGTSQTQSAGQPPRRRNSVSMYFMKDSVAVWWSVIVTLFFCNTKQGDTHIRPSNSINSSSTLYKQHIMAFLPENCESLQHWQQLELHPSIAMTACVYPTPYSVQLSGEDKDMKNLVSKAKFLDHPMLTELGLPQECCSAEDHRSPLLQSQCPCTSHWTGML